MVDGTSTLLFFFFGELVELEDRTYQGLVFTVMENHSAISYEYMYLLHISTLAFPSHIFITVPPLTLLKGIIFPNNFISLRTSRGIYTSPILAIICVYVRL